MKPKVAKIALTTVDQVIHPSENVTLIVGPNNAGKSALLSSIYSEITRRDHHPKPISTLLESIDVDMPSLHEMERLLEQRGKLYAVGDSLGGTIFREPTYVLPGGKQVGRSVVRGVASNARHFGELGGVISHILGPENRGEPLQSTSVPDMLQSQALTPLQMLWGDREFEAVISAYMERAFGRPLLVNRHAGARVHLHMGQVQIGEPRIGERGGYADYLTEVMKLPLVAEQGAGIQAFMGTVLTLAASTFDIVLLDEPETFLHPPQARLLGEVVVRMSRDGGPQIIVATHSDDFVQGVIGAARDGTEVSVVRITRPSDTENHVAQVTPSAIKSLYRDPLMRYSKIMEGIFYKGAVVCEAESDCTYYSAVLGTVEEAGMLSSSDILFTHCSGKSRMARAVDALKASAVPTVVIADIDILAERDEFVGLVTAMGGDFNRMSANYNVLSSAVRDKRIEPKREVAAEGIAKILDGSTSVALSQKEIDRIRKIIKLESGWLQIKNSGVSGLPKGPPTRAFNSIASCCREIGLFILPVGELEGFHPEIPAGNKQAWLRAVLEGELFRIDGHGHQLLRDVREFVSSSQ